MKRSWIGFSLLLVLLTASLLTTRTMVKIHKPIAGQLQQAAQLAQDEDWPRAEACFRQAQTDWEAKNKLRSCFADHGPVEEIDGEFAALEVCCTRRDTVSFASGCQSLARQVEAVGQAHAVVWWNLL